MNQCFELVRPMVEFTAKELLARANNVFVFQALVSPRSERLPANRDIHLTSSDTSKDSEENGEAGEAAAAEEDADGGGDHEHKLMIRGTLMYMDLWKKIFFLGCPIIDSLHVLHKNGLFINDLSTHDHSRETLMINAQQQVNR